MWEFVAGVMLRKREGVWVNASCEAEAEAMLWASLSTMRVPASWIIGPTKVGGGGTLSGEHTHLLCGYANAALIVRMEHCCIVCMRMGSSRTRD